jgi:FkbM family methyltransferase
VSRKLAGRGMGLARLPGVQPVYDWICRRIEPDGIVEVDVHGSRMFFDTRLETPLRSLLSVGTYEAFETKVFQSLLRPGIVVADIGANIGYYTLISARAAGDTGLVLAFEPDPRNFALLRRSVEANGYRNVSAQQMALSNRSGSLTLYADAVNAGNSTLGRGNVLRELCQYTVKTETLDDFMAREGRNRRIDLIKMDVQGAEGLVLQGASGVLHSSPLTMMMEFEPDKLESLSTDPAELLVRLADYGFRTKIIDGKRAAVREATQAEILAVSAQRGYVNLLLEK